MSNVTSRDLTQGIPTPQAGVQNQSCVPVPCAIRTARSLKLQDFPPSGRLPPQGPTPFLGLLANLKGKHPVPGPRGAHSHLAPGEASTFPRPAGFPVASDRQPASGSLCTANSWGLAPSHDTTRPRCRTDHRCGVCPAGIQTAAKFHQSAPVLPSRAPGACSPPSSLRFYSVGCSFIPSLVHSFPHSFL